MAWQARLALNVRREGARSVARHAHEGPLRLLKAHHPEGPGVCHQVLLHPPGGIVGGDAFAIDLDIGPGAHALLTTAAPTALYRSGGAKATQRVDARVAAAGLLEWLPQATVVHSGARLASRLRFELAPDAQMIGWDLWVLGLPASGVPWRHGELAQTLEIPGVWLDQMRLHARAPRVLDSPLGWAGRRVYGTLWWAGGSAVAAQEGPPPLAVEVAEAAAAALAGAGAGDPTRGAGAPHTAADLAAEPIAPLLGITSPHPRLWVARGLAWQLEPLHDAFVAIRQAWRAARFGLDAPPPRVWPAAQRG